MSTKYLLYVSDSGDRAQPVVSGAKRESAVRLADMFKAAASGSTNGMTLVARNSAVAASRTITLSSASGDISAVINGVTITVTYATSDANTASLLAAAINASSDALVANHVTASAAAGVVTVTAVLPGRTGNTITIAATGTGATAAGARLTGGSDSIVSTTY